MSVESSQRKIPCYIFLQLEPGCLTIFHSVVFCATGAKLATAYGLLDQFHQIFILKPAMFLNAKAMCSSNSFETDVFDTTCPC